MNIKHTERYKLVKVVVMTNELIVEVVICVGFNQELVAVSNEQVEYCYDLEYTRIYACEIYFIYRYTRRSSIVFKAQNTRKLVLVLIRVIMES